MKIGIITDETEDRGNPGRFSNFLLNTIEEIQKQDKKNQYYLIHRKKEKYKIYKKSKEILVPYNPQPPFSTYRNFIALPKIIKKYHLDVVHHPANTGPFVFKSLLPGKKNIQTVHDLIPFIHPEYYEWPVRITFKHLLPRIIKNVDKVIAVSNFTKEDIVKHLHIPRSKITVIHEGVSDLFKPNNNNIVKKKYGVKDYILYVGALEPKKNIETLLKAFQILKKKGRKEKLILVGKKGWEYKPIEETIQKLGLQKDIIATGFVPTEDLPKYHGSAKCYVTASFYEGFGLPALEAMKCGCPVIVSDRGSLPEIVGKAGLVVKATDIRGFADAMYMILSNNKKRAEMKKQSLKRAKEFTWKESAKKTIALYNSLAKSITSQPR